MSTKPGAIHLFMAPFQLAVGQLDLDEAWPGRVHQQTMDLWFCRTPNLIRVPCADSAARTPPTFCHVLGHRSPLMAVAALKV